VGVYHLAKNRQLVGANPAWVGGLRVTISVGKRVYTYEIKEKSWVVVMVVGFFGVGCSYIRGIYGAYRYVVCIYIIL
jgi:hypothetical protein